MAPTPTPCHPQGLDWRLHDLIPLLTLMRNRKRVVGIFILCMLALLPDPSSLLYEHVDVALRESAKGDCEGDGS